jgi:hypothetical protein
MQPIKELPPAAIRQGAKNSVIIHTGNMQPFGYLSRRDLCWSTI